MIEQLPQRTYGKKQQAVFLGREQNEEQDYSEETAVKIDKEISELNVSKGEQIQSNLAQQSFLDREAASLPFLNDYMSY